MFKCVPKESFDSPSPVTLFVLHTCLEFRELGIIILNENVLNPFRPFFFIYLCRDNCNVRCVYNKGSECLGMP